MPINKLLLIFFLISCFVNSKSQQNYFNVPSGEITEKKKFFFQYQLNAKNQLLQNNLTLDFGLGHHYEAGVNLFDLNTSSSTFPGLLKNSGNTDPLAPLVLLNMQKAIVFRNWSVSAGFQAGGNLLSKFNPAVWKFGLIKRRFKKNKAVVTFGIYSGNIGYLGMGSKRGIMAGLEKPIYRFNRDLSLKINADFVSGNNSIAVSVPGLVLSWKDKIMLSAGAQIPLAQKNESAFVFEFTWNI